MRNWDVVRFVSHYMKHNELHITVEARVSIQNDWRSGKKKRDVEIKWIRHKEFGYRQERKELAEQNILKLHAKRTVTLSRKYK
jgi:hypothetical protein